MPDDLLFDAIFSRVLSDASAVARCAGVCRRWGRVLAAREADIRRSLPPPAGLLPQLALGFFHVGLQHSSRRRLSSDQERRPCLFVPTASASVLLGSPFPGLLLDLPQGGGGARPVASRNGRVVMELRSEARSDGLALAVCDPMTGAVAIVPPLAGADFPGHDYACAILTADDLLDDAPPAGFSFSLLLVYNRRGFTALRCYTATAAGQWGPEARKPGAAISCHVLRHLGPGVVLRGVAYWPMNAAALGVRLDGAGAAVVDVCTVPYLRHMVPDWRLLGRTLDGKLSYVCAGVAGEGLCFVVETLDLQMINKDDDDSAVVRKWVMREFIILDQFTVSEATELKVRWLGERSGALLFTMGRRGGGSSGAFVLNLSTREVEKLADGVECNDWRNVFGYEMDHAALVASITAPFS